MAIDTSCPWPDINANATSVSGHTGSDKAVACARRWLDVCLLQHSTCDRAEAVSLPTRVIRIDGPQDVKLHISNNDTAAYVCLSHCWGARPIITTTVSSLRDHQTRIAWEQLPRTFQDAVSFAYRLGFAYIWIDSLCIIQDSVDDWRHEGSRMADIYKNASLTLAATLSSESSGGCFATAHPLHMSHKWNLIDSQGHAFEVYSRKSLHTKRTVEQLPLLTRAWAFQERIMSPRVLHFTTNELLWECSSGQICECYPNSNGIASSKLPVPHILPPKTHGDWREVVVAYTGMSLTYPKDIFPALQALAKSMPSVMGPYLAGLWTNQLAWHLSWYSAVPQSRPIEWRAPTWSWASVEAPIYWTVGHLLGNYETNITVIDAKTSPKGDDATGGISAGELVVTGRGVKGLIRHARSQRVSDLIVPLGDSQESYIHDGTGVNLHWDYLINAPGEHHVPDGSDVLVLRAGKAMQTYVGLSYSFWLILRKAPQDPESFERIGFLKLRESLDRSASQPRLLYNAWDASPEIKIRII